MNTKALKQALVAAWMDGAIAYDAERLIDFDREAALKMAKEYAAKTIRRMQRSGILASGADSNDV